MYWLVAILCSCICLTAMERIVDDGVTFHAVRLDSPGVTDIHVTDRQTTVVPFTAATFTMLDKDGKPTGHTIMASCYGSRRDGLITIIPIQCITTSGHIALGADTVIGDTAPRPASGVSPAKRDDQTWSIPAHAPITIWMRLDMKDAAAIGFK